MAKSEGVRRDYKGGVGSSFVSARAKIMLDDGVPVIPKLHARVLDKKFLSNRNITREWTSFVFCFRRQASLVLMEQLAPHCRGDKQASLIAKNAYSLLYENPEELRKFLTGLFIASIGSGLLSEDDYLRLWDNILPGILGVRPDTVH
jgi:hypothetical protein